MNERRNHWKENFSKEAQKRMDEKLRLLTQLDAIRDELRACGTDFQRRDEVSLKYRETVAKLAAL